MRLPDLREFARGQDCTIRIPGVCNFDPDTTVLCHDRAADISGMGQKSCDLNGAHGCSSCHAVVDGAKTHWSHDEVRLMFHEGKARTLERVWRLLAA